MSRLYPDTDVLVFGHSHIPWDSTSATGLRLLNPGSPTDRRRQPQCTYMTASVCRRRTRCGHVAPDPEGLTPPRILPPMKSDLLSRRDLDFLLFEWLDVEALTKRPRFADHSAETFGDVLDLCEQLATRYFANHNKRNDANEPTFDGTTVTVIPEVKEAWDAVAASDLLAMAMDNEFGGAQLPIPWARPASRGWRRPTSPRRATRC